MELTFEEGSLEAGLEETFRQIQVLQNKVNGTDVIRLQREEIANLFQIVHEVVLPAYAGKQLLLHEGRPARSFDTELQRLWALALSEFINHFRPRLPAFLNQIMAAQEDGGEAQLQSFMKMVLERITIPLLNGYELPGDDLFLLILDSVVHLEGKSLSDHIAETLETPQQTQASVYAICGLLIQAQKAAEAEKTDIAYSYLIDANFLLGMRKASDFIMHRFDTIADTRKAKANARKKHLNAAQVNLGKRRVAELYYSLRGTGSLLTLKPWKSANIATDKIMEVIDREGDPKITISELTTRKICREMMKQEEKERKRQGVVVTASYRLPDGSTLTVTPED
ncbi:hypothetical protein RA263_19705 [Pseudomonas syringae pv. tagetis]|uniref:Uncharacterized protein n=2 Tax=Pseudomonas syringae group TaxID=136849 RepID=A0A0Q0BIK1_9PSED|nr:hypothetical protein [Pseudomonas syringae group genomosp. 7]KPY89797.1 Uncharacterized protein ALO44_00767 [Pseudomonas syringae pv. tagetis]RMW14380.1 hypothetical protein ALO98_01890 [Pseudomonas syringae pv. tagetis]RMW22053.1 hypothetical protein ALO97_200037 [Pseudomonas syringae pv. tagetis]UNB68611.1 hypothetical protein MME58_26255 [Pseudomonas syringae pv. tagetis]